MTQFDFALLAYTLVPVTEEQIFDLNDALIDATGDDFVMTATGKCLIIDFYRESISYSEAVLSAIKQVQQVNNIKVKSVDAGQYVGLSDAAELSSMSRSALSKYSKGERGDGTFPTPFLRAKGKVPLYEWAEIAQWLEKNGLVEKGIAENATFTAMINTALSFNTEELEQVAKMERELHLA
ncbi:hypothetical protein [Photobacterium iliopiscarium]|uniref:hypothetical protein n=1 Tax=Photobacterium iliopiscarium TaxID=56192 RepID=UPI0006960857|nr:hypothetical protein [Photobacterium iliopiscarium]PST96836.1 DNA-binding protein [Photobacterium iliopiscarium]PSV79016.1 DNA-binding protein [Photobacterium iliopiscarium]